MTIHPEVSEKFARILNHDGTGGVKVMEQLADRYTATPKSYAAGMAKKKHIVLFVLKDGCYTEELKLTAVQKESCSLSRLQAKATVNC